MKRDLCGPVLQRSLVFLIPTKRILLRFGPERHRVSHTHKHVYERIFAHFFLEKNVPAIDTHVVIVRYVVCCRGWLWSDEHAPALPLRNCPMTLHVGTFGAGRWSTVFVSRDYARKLLLNGRCDIGPLRPVIAGASGTQERTTNATGRSPARSHFCRRRGCRRCE